MTRALGRPHPFARGPSWACAYACACACACACAFTILLLTAGPGHASEAADATTEAPSPAAAAPAPDAQVRENQRVFALGVQALTAGDYPRAAFIFERLYARTRAERVRLEWARSLYLLGAYRQAAAQFEAVLATRPPLPVQDTIRLWLEDIETLTGRWDYGVELGKDSNPRYVPAVRQFFLFGLPFTYQPSGDTGPQWGLGYRLGYSRTMDAARRWVLSAGLSGREFANASLDRRSVELKAGWRPTGDPREEFSAFAESQRVGREQGSDAGGFSARHLLLQEARQQAQQEARIGRIRYAGAAYMDATFAAYQVTLDRAIGPRQKVSLSTYWDRQFAAEKPYASVGGQLSVAYLHAFAPAQWRSSLRVTTGARRYAAPDPLFGLTRRDQRRLIELEIEKTDWRVGAFTPVFTLGREQNRSTLALNSYDRNLFSVQLRKPTR